MEGVGRRAGGKTELSSVELSTQTFQFGALGGFSLGRGMNREGSVIYGPGGFFPFTLVSYKYQHSLVCCDTMTVGKYQVLSLGYQVLSF